MSIPPRHYRDELQDWIDQRLDAATCEEVERHLENCAECRREYEAMAWTHQQTTRRVQAATAPMELRAKILQSLRAEQSASESEIIRPVFWRNHFRPLLAAAAMLLLAGVLAAAYFLSPTRLTDELAIDYRAYQAKKLVLELTTSDVKVMEAFFTRRGVSFNTRVFDLGMMKYQLVGGRVQTPGSHPRALFVYSGPADRKLVCQMYAGRVDELPEGASLREHKGIQFHTYQKKGLTAVFWQEGAIVCVLVADGNPEEVVQLAFAKAMP